ncbi:hypothetical protein [Kribbella sp. HUAS MG21]|uniref:Uncharacterized protein n=1 Tax=Kribbella sp. HUAS MG21 TaxID=3160966 RepID=A0AAU7T5C3_9ACTN
MTAIRARDALVVVDGDEVPGITIYGLAGRGRRQAAAFPRQVWIGEPGVDAFLLRGDAWEILSWDVPIIVWPTGEYFTAAVRDSLAARIGAGCSVAWVGAEGLPFCDPPELFNPTCMSGGVLAWMTAGGQFECALDPDRPLSPASDRLLSSLRQYAQGLADVT